MKVLIVSNTPPMPSWGGAFALYRHFCERNDFNIKVITDNVQVYQYTLPYSFLFIKKSKYWIKLSKTRFYLIPHTLDKLEECVSVTSQMMKFAQDFKPDAVLTIAGSWTWMALLAKKISRKLDVPLIGSFMDWWYYSTLFHSRASKMIEARFRKFYQQCDLALCISEGMRNELGTHRNAVVLYPIGAKKDFKSSRVDSGNEIFTVAFAGNLGEWYGKMLENLVKASRNLEIKFAVFGSNPSWSVDFDSYAKERNIYRGSLPFTELQEQIKYVDGLLLLMGFEESSVIIETTSFKTKFLDYISFEKPIMLWGPTYCSAVKTAKEFSSAEICTSAAAEEFLKSILKVKENKSLQKELTMNAQRMYEERFHPDNIHAILKSSIQALIDPALNEVHI